MAENRAKRRTWNISRIIALGFAGIIVLGTALLCLPFASRSGEACGIRTALFTATSAGCVTGLILRDTWSQWNGFGQTVILCLIETGGLGFMSVASLVFFAFRKKINMRQRMAFSQSIGLDDAIDVKHMYRRILKGSLSVEGIGALILTLRFMPVYGFGRAWKLGVFHSVSAFCNAGFDIFGFEKPGSSMMLYGTDPAVCFTLSALIILGGLGFIVWDEIISKPSPKKWSVYTKLVMITSAALIVLGMILILLAEWGNPATLGSMRPAEKLLAGFFQSVTCRTAGFAGIDQGAMTDAGKAMSMFIMLIGGSSGSTAGGLKTVTFIVLVLFLWSRVRGKDNVRVFHRTISNRHVLNAVTLFCIMIALAFIGGTVICATSQVSFTDGLFEAVSAIATVGLTTGITPGLSLGAQLLMILFMYFGRVGILTFSLGFLREPQAEQFRYAETDVLIG